MLKSKTKILKDCFLNHIVGGRFDLSYIVEAVDWSISWDGRQITNGLNEQNLLKSRVSTCPWGLKNKLIHYGSVNVFHLFGLPHKSAKAILTWFHFVPGEKNGTDKNIKNDYIRQNQEKFRFIHTSCSQTKDHLVDFGIEESKIEAIPLGVDLNLFKPISLADKEAMKEKFDLPKDRIIIGSFQKDGSGWGEGMEPKMIKGPDVLLKTLEKLGKDFPLFVLLAGPARGYIKSNLEKLKIPFLDLGNLKLQEIPKAYSLIDLYIIASRIEGGPKAILESMASGVPLVSTKTGMAPDIKKIMPQFQLSEIEDYNDLAEKAGKIIVDKNLRETIIEEQIKTASNFSWQTIAQQYFSKMYSKII